eukprot:12890797-Prorocentrum_lima.AAC.1
MAHWPPSALTNFKKQGYEQFVFTILKHEVSAAIKREFDNLSPGEMKTHRKEVAEAKLAELKRWQDLKCFQRMPRRDSTDKVDGAWVLKWKK